MSKYTIDANELTLAQLDEIQNLTDTKGIGQITASAYVFIKHHVDATITLKDVGKLKAADLDFIEEAAEPDANLGSA
jgi:hypothetical protein